MLKYTICFIRKRDKLLLLNRNKSPNMGMWNGVGGKIEQNESPQEGVIRETLEETGISLQEVKYAGDVTWDSNRGNAGMHVFIADLPKVIDLYTPITTREGVLEWKDIDWVLDKDNIGVVGNIKMYLPKILAGQYMLEHKFVYRDGKVLDYCTSPLSNNDVIKV